MKHVPLIPTLIAHAEKVHMQQAAQRENIARQFGGSTFSERLAKIKQLRG